MRPAAGGFTLFSCMYWKKKCKSAKILPQLVIILHYRSFIKHLYELHTAWCADYRGGRADEGSEAWRERKNITRSHGEAAKDPLFLSMFRKNSELLSYCTRRPVSDSASKTKRQFESQTEACYGLTSLPGSRLSPSRARHGALKCIKAAAPSRWPI